VKGLRIVGVLLLVLVVLGSAAYVVQARRGTTSTFMPSIVRARRIRRARRRASAFAFRC
jgi:hypothetical protein